MTTQTLSPDIVSEQNLEQLFSQAPAPIAIYKGRELRYVFVNEAYSKIFNHRDILNKTLREAFPELQGQGYYEILENVFDSGKPYHASETPALIDVANDGRLSTRYYNLVYTPLKNENGVIEGVMAFGHDVTDQVHARKTAEGSEEKYRSLFNSMDQGFCILELIFDAADRPFDYRFLEINPVFEKQTGLKNAIGKTARELVPSLESRWFELYGKVALTGESIRFIEGSEAMGRWFEVYAFRMGGPESRNVALLFSDITRRKQAEEALEEKVRERTKDLEKLNNDLKRSNANLEEFAHAASHDLKEPVRKVHFFTDRLKTKLGDRLHAEELQLLERIENATGRMRLLIDDLLEYSHVNHLNRDVGEVNLNQKIKLVLSDLEILIQEKGATVAVDPLPVIKGHRRQLQQLFQNLISNALKYSKPGVAPVISITAHEVAGSEAGIPLPGDEGNKRFHLIEVKDNGIGFNQADSERIFQMFQRLHGKKEYSGTGVGLAIVKKVVANHSGYIWAESSPGEGAVFTVLLPKN